MSSLKKTRADLGRSGVSTGFSAFIDPSHAHPTRARQQMAAARDDTDVIRQRDHHKPPPSTAHPADVNHHSRRESGPRWANPPTDRLPRTSCVEIHVRRRGRHDRVKSEGRVVSGSVSLRLSYVTDPLRTATWDLRLVDARTGTVRRTMATGTGGTVAADDRRVAWVAAGCDATARRMWLTGRAPAAACASSAQAGHSGGPERSAARAQLVWHTSRNGRLATRSRRRPRPAHRRAPAPSRALHTREERARSDLDQGQPAAAAGRALGELLAPGVPAHHRP